MWVCFLSLVALSDVEDNAVHKFLSRIFDNTESSLITQVEKHSDEYEDDLNDTYLLAVTAFAIGCHLIFTGIATKILSLSIIISIVVYRYLELVLDDNVVTWPFYILAPAIKSILEVTSHPYLVALVLSFLISLTFIIIISGVRFVFAIVVMYFVYNNFIGGVIDFSTNTERYIYIASFIVALGLISFIYIRILNGILIMSFSATGGLLAFITVEKTFNFQSGMDLINIVTVIKEDWMNQTVSAASLLYFTVVSFGVFIQAWFIPEIKILN